MPVFACRMPPAYGAFARGATGLVLAVCMSVTMALAGPAAARPLRPRRLWRQPDGWLQFARRRRLPHAAAGRPQGAGPRRRGGERRRLRRHGTGDGLARLDWTLGDGADAVILELGANDMLRGIDPKLTADNLDEDAGCAEGASTSRCCSPACARRRAWGRLCAGRFAAIYPALAKRYDVPLYPFFLDGVIGDRKLHLPDQLHPTGEGVGVIVQRIPARRRQAARRGAGEELSRRLERRRPVAAVALEACALHPRLPPPELPANRAARQAAGFVAPTPFRPIGRSHGSPRLHRLARRHRHCRDARPPGLRRRARPLHLGRDAADGLAGEVHRLGGEEPRRGPEIPGRALRPLSPPRRQPRHDGRRRTSAPS